MYWPGMYGEVKDYIDSCERCTMGRAPVIHTTSGHLLASRPLEILAIDFTKMETASGGKEDILTDVFTMFSLAIPASNQEAVTIAKVLVRDWFQCYGVPQRIDSDQDRNFESKLVSAFCELYGIHKTRTMPYHPRGNAQCERFNRSLDDLLRSLPPELKTKWPQYLPELVQAYNNTPHASTGFLPHFLLFGQEPQLPVDYPLGREAPSAVGPTDWVRQHRLWLQDAHAIALKHLQQAVTERVKQTDQRAADHPLNVGDLVYMRNRVVGRSKIQDRWRPDICSQAICWWTGTDRQSRRSVACQNPVGGCQRRTTTSIKCAYATRTAVSRPRRILVGSASQRWSSAIISNNRCSKACDCCFQPFTYSRRRRYNVCPTCTETLCPSKQGY